MNRFDFFSRNFWVKPYHLNSLVLFQDPNEDTEWNDILRSKGILGPKEPEITEESLVNMVEQAIENKMNSEC